MKKFTFGRPEKLVPSLYCDGFNYNETPVSFCESDFSCRQTSRGFVLELELEEGTQVFGFGLQLKRLNHTGAKVTLSCNADPQTPNGDSHAPVPFLVTNKGYGLYFDTARTAEFYCGVLKTERAENNQYEVKLSEQELYAAETNGKRILSVFIPVAQGVDVYVIEGKTILDITAQYNMLSGGGCSAPDWALGVLYRTNGTYNAEQVLDVARYMRENELPCDTIG
ncbi:MAG: glycoside hydrolase, partial [Clostridia bacterium]|nr:glycoside hydrolase [Clostridia bacterium]